MSADEISLISHYDPTLMPFHDYSVSFRGKPKNQHFRHSSPPIYDCTKDSKSKVAGGSGHEDFESPLKDDKSTEAILKHVEKSDRAKGLKTPSRSYSNPAYFEGCSKAKKESKHYQSLDNHEDGVSKSGTTDSAKQNGQKIPANHRRYYSFNGVISPDKKNHLNTDNTEDNEKVQKTSSLTKPTILVSKPPVPTGSPLASVKLRSRPTSSPKGSRKRQGLVLDSQSISNPILISHQISSTETGVKLREIEQQEELLNKLQIKPSAIKTEKPPFAPESNSVGTRMAERIQRTIKALYTSNSSQKKPYNMQEQLIPEEHGNRSDDSGIEEKVSVSSQFEASSPKFDKRLNRKRSPRTGQKNNLQLKDVDGSRRFKWRGSVNKIVKKFGTGQPFVLYGTFGVHLEDCPSSPLNEFVPFIVELCCRIVEERGLHFTGIYRVPGNNAALLALQEDLNNHGVESIHADDERLRDLNVVSSLLKSFFRKLPEPLFTNELYHNFIQANRQQPSEKRLNNLRRLVHMLPGPHYETLKFLICHLRLVADNCETNKMEVRNLAIVFGPTLVRNTAADNTATMVTDMSDQCRIIESIIDHAEWFFTNTHDPAPECSDAAVPAEREHEAVPSIDFLLNNVGRKPGDTGNATCESAKSKGSDDSEKDSFSRDLMDLLFGKKWKQSTHTTTQADEDDGGFEAYRIKKKGETLEKKELSAHADISKPLKQAQASESQSIPNVSERLLNFYREHLERLSQTTIGQTLPAFSSADSSPRTTPRHSTVFNAPLVFSSMESIVNQNMGQRSRINSDNQDPRYTAPSPKGHSLLAESSSTKVEGVLHMKSIPQYKHPPNPYEKEGNALTDMSPVSATRTVLTGSAEHRLPRIDGPVKASNATIPEVMPFEPKLQSYNSDEVILYADESMQRSAHNELKKTEVDAISGETNPACVNERLVDHMPRPVEKFRASSHKTSPSSDSTGTMPNAPTRVPKPSDDSNVNTKFSLKNASMHKVEQTASLRQPEPKPIRKKTPLKQNFSSSFAVGASSDRKFSRYDPKRRGIRFGAIENDHVRLQGNANSNTSPGNRQLTASERLFNGQPIRRKLTVRENRKQKVIRRHTLSGIQDIEEHSPLIKNKKFMSNLQKNGGWNLSMYDLACSSAQGQSAVERLKPKGAASGMTLSNWIVQERLRSKTAPHYASVTGNSGAVGRRKESKGQIHSYV